MTEPMYTITIVVDENDGDYVTSVSDVNEKSLGLLKELFEKVKALKAYTGMSKRYGTTWTHTHNFPWSQARDDLGEMSAVLLYGIDDELLELLYDILPRCEYGFHDIVKVSYHIAVAETTLL